MSNHFESHYGPVTDGTEFCWRDLYFCKHNLYNDDVTCYQLKKFDYSVVCMTDHCTKISDTMDYYNSVLKTGFLVPVLPIYKYLPEHTRNDMLKKKLLNHVNRYMIDNDKYKIWKEFCDEMKND